MTIAAPTATQPPSEPEPPPPAGALDVVVDRATVVVVLDDADVAVEEVDDMVNAITWSAEAARRRPAPTDGVGKWFAGAPTTACSRSAPVEGSSPKSVPS